MSETDLPQSISPVTETVEPVNLKDLRWMGYGICRHAADEIAYLRAEVERLTSVHAQTRQQPAIVTESLDTIDRQLNEMRSLKGWRLNLIRENMAKLRCALSDTSTDRQTKSNCRFPDAISPEPPENAQ